MKVILALNRVTSRRSGQRRDVPENKSSNVTTLISNVVTFQRVVKINVAMFQRGSNSTSRRWDLTSRRSRVGSN